MERRDKRISLKKLGSSVVIMMVVVVVVVVVVMANSK